MDDTGIEHSAPRSARPDPTRPDPTRPGAAVVGPSVLDFSVLDHDGPWTESEYLALPRGSGRVEVVEGTLLVGPGAPPRRAAAVARVREAIADALPDGLALIGPVPLRLGQDCVLLPDLVVVAESTDTDAPAVLDAGAALMVVEFVGRDHGAVGRRFKPQLYARSRIPYSLLIDHDGPFAVAEMIINGRYHEYASATDGASLLLEEPFHLELDLGAVTAPVGATRDAAAVTAETPVVS